MSSSNLDKSKRVEIPRSQPNYQNFKPRATFVQQLPFWDRHRRGVIFGGAFLTVLILFSAPLYQIFRTPPEHIDPRSTMWPGEIAKGKTYAQQFRERQLRFRSEAEEKKAAKAKLNEKKD